MKHKNNRRLTNARRSGTNHSLTESPRCFSLKPIAKALQVGALGLGLAQSAQALTITVDSAADDGTGCTLREAIEVFNTNTFPPFTNGCNTYSGTLGTDDTVIFGGAMANGGTINLEPDPDTGGRELIIASSASIFDQNQITIDASTTSGVTIATSGPSGVFDVEADFDTANTLLEIHNLTLTGGSRSSGGAVDVENFANFTAYDSTISNNAARLSVGGGISADGDSVVRLFNCTISHNTAATDGGGIFQQNGEGTLYLNNTQVSNNTAQAGEGGGIRSGGLNEGDGAQITLVGSQVTANTAGEEGGGIYAQGKINLSLTNSSVSSNTSGLSTANGHGGGIYLFNNTQTNESELIITGSDIADNVAGGASAYGGGIYFYSPPRATISGPAVNPFTITDSTISGNSATGGGGGIFKDGRLFLGGDTYQHMDTSNTTISNNSAALGGGGVMIRNAALILDNTRITNNQTAASGGGVHVDDDSVVHSSANQSNAGAVISGNSAGFRGGGVYLAPFSGGVNGLPSVGAAPNQLLSAVISNNRSGDRGGGIFQYGTNGPVSEGGVLEIENSTLSGNTSGTAGGGDLTMVGGAMATSSDGRISIENTTFSGNVAGGAGGGAIYNTGELDMSHVTMSNNTAPALSNILGSVGLTNSIIANTVAGNGMADCNPAGPVTVDAFTIIEDGSCNATRMGDPGLEPLRNNGGPTQTHRLMEDSIARDTGGTTCPAVDQRYEVRLGTLQDACDVGSFELTDNDLATFFVIPLPNGGSVVIVL